ncbi:MAG: T9SS type A sorting domain-containing protein, partial [Calditrichaeota bacterium]|nr:T9SS type A sorting domain-containing protein [Calditrichota bacterium]
YTHVYNILGDPEVNLYFDAPFRLDVEHADELSVGDTYTLFTVKDEDGDPVYKALVTLYKADETEISVLTDADGEALTPVRLDSEGELEVTVIARQAAPYLGTINVTAPERNIGFESVVIGDGDGTLEAGEPVNLTVTLRNTGSSAVSGVEAALSTNMEGVRITDAIADFGNINSGESSVGDAFTVEIPHMFPNSYILAFILDITDANDNHYEALFRVTMSAGHIGIDSYELEGGSISAGEAGNMVINITNISPLDLSGITATIHTHDNSIIVLDDAAVFGNIASGESADCAANPFRIEVEDGVTDGRQVNMRIAFYNSDDQHISSTRFNITIGEVDAADPIGPESYGYYAYENIDDHPNAPEYNWIELDPDYDGAGADLHRLEDDITFVMDLPFEFTFYGAPFNSIAICSNGWVSFEPTTEHINFRNWGMPSPLGPHSMIAPFWEDLVGEALNDSTRDLLDILTRYDQDEGRFIIEWSRVYARTSVEDHVETFELILFDPEEHQTETGDGMFLMQYNEAIVVDVRETNYATVGIQDWNHMRGLEITFSNIYHPAAAEITDGRAILFTTAPPDSFLGLNDAPSVQPCDFGIMDVYPNPFNARTRINYNLPKGDVAKLMVCDLNGRLVKELENGFMEAGSYTAVLNFASLPSGLYIIRLEAGSLNSQKKLIYIR